jgi:hypothetical protein
MDLARTGATAQQPLSPLIKWVLPGSVVALTVALIGGYEFHWTWTGVNPSDQLWDWLRLLLVPFVLPATLAWFSARAESERESRGRARV